MKVYFSMFLGCYYLKEFSDGNKNMKFRSVLSLSIFIFIFQLTVMRPNVAVASDDTEHIMSVQVPVLTGIVNYLKLFESPPYVAVTLGDNGIAIGNLDNLNVVNNKLFIWSGISVEFIKKDTQQYFYDANLITAFGKVLPKIRILLNVSDIMKGFVRVSVYSKIASIMPQEFKSKFEPRLLSIFSIENQKKVLGYLQRLSENNNQKNIGHNIGELILINSRALGKNSLIYSDIHSDKFGSITILLYIITIALIGIPFYVLRKARKRGVGND